MTRQQPRPGISSPASSTCSTSTSPTGTPSTTPAGRADLLDRLDRHAAGRGARLVEVIWQAGIGFTLVRICEGTRATERAIKNARRRVPVLPGLHPPSPQRPLVPGHRRPDPPRHHPNPASRR